MNRKKGSKAAYLFREMGGIDDYLLQEALIYRPMQRRTPRVRMIAACLSLSLLLVMGGVLIGKRASDQESNTFDDELQSTPEEYGLDALFEDLNAEAVTADEVDLFSAPVVVWQSEASDELFVSQPLTASELIRLTRHLGSGEEVGKVSPTQAYRVWIVSGDGRVITPYLKLSVGNIGTELFDYEPEILPSEGFISCLEEILRS